MKQKTKDITGKNERTECAYLSELNLREEAQKMEE